MAWSDAHTPLAVLQDALRQFNAERDWGRYHNPRNLAMALSVEAGELLELYLWSSDEGPQPAVPARAPRVAEEAADVLICLLNLCAHAGVDLSAALEAKLAKNALKYPAEAASGRLEKYDELRAAHEEE
jgi:NTP pyrophosphatase (non-canonical NTP hydrolase)